MRRGSIAPEEHRGREGCSGPPSAVTIENAPDAEIEMFWLSGGRDRKSYVKIAPGGTATQQTYSILDPQSMISYPFPTPRHTSLV